MAPKASKGAKAPRQASSSSSGRTAYLVLYNVASAAAWAVVVARTLSVVAVEPNHYPLVYPRVGEWIRWTQTAAIMEVVHSALGIVRAPLFTTLTQIASRYLLVWLAVHPFPEVALSPFYSSMLLAWSITEVIRYSFFAFTLAGYQPRPLLWLRYNTFLVLYPIGICSECVLLLASTGPAVKVHEALPYFYYAALVTYIPGSYMLYTYMLTQRRKVMRQLRTKDVQATR